MSRPLVCLVRWGTYVAIVGLSIGALTAGAEKSDQQLQVIADASLQNRESFVTVNCSFRVRYGMADSQEKAITEGPTRLIASAKGIWIVNNDSIRYELNVSPRELENEARKVLDIGEDAGPGRIVARGINLQLVKKLWNGSKGISYSGRLHGGGFMPPEATGPDIQMTPFDMAGMMGRDERFHPGRLILSSFDDEMVSCTYSGVSEFGGCELVVLTINRQHQGSTETTTYDYAIDPDRSFLPIRLSYHHSDPKQSRTEVYVTDVQERSANRWFPMRTVKIVVPADGPDSNRGLEVFEIEVVSLDVDVPPAEDSMAIQIPAGARMHDGAKPGSQVGFTKSRQVGIHDLGWLADKMEEARREYVSEEAKVPIDIPTSGNAGHRWWWITANAVLVAVLVGLMVFRRYCC